MYQQVAPIEFYVKKQQQTNKQTYFQSTNNYIYTFVSSICRSTFLELRKIASICSNLFRISINSQASFLHSMIISRLDYCSSKGYRPSRLYACRKSRTTLPDLNCHAESILLHCWKNCTGFRWNSEFITYKIATFAYRHLEGSPLHICVSLRLHQPSRSLRSSHEKLLKIPETNLKTFGQCSLIYIHGPLASI